MTSHFYFSFQTVREVYNQHMASVLATVEKPLSLNGDGRFDSPGHSALYGMYSFMDSRSSKIVANVLVKVRYDCYKYY